MKREIMTPLLAISVFPTRAARFDSQYRAQAAIIVRVGGARKLRISDS